MAKVDLSYPGGAFAYTLGALLDPSELGLFVYGRDYVFEGEPS